MKILFILLSISTLLLFGSCREQKPETVKIIREVPVETEEIVPKDNEGILERTAEKIDEEVNKEINEEIEKIGDDN